MTRQEAINAGLKKYNTGEPCKNGHLADRYVQSGGCQECIHPKGEPNPSTSIDRLALERERIASAERIATQRIALELKKLEIAQAKLKTTPLAAQERAARREWKSEMVKVRLHVHEDDIEAFRAILFDITRATEPSVTMADIFTTASIEMSGPERLYRVSIFARDVAAVRAAVEALYKPRGDAKLARIAEEREVRKMLVAPPIDAGPAEPQGVPQ